MTICSHEWIDRDQLQSCTCRRAFFPSEAQSLIAKKWSPLHHAAICKPLKIQKIPAQGEKHVSISASYAIPGANLDATAQTPAYPKAKSKYQDVSLLFFESLNLTGHQLRLKVTIIKRSQILDHRQNSPPQTHKKQTQA